MDRKACITRAILIFLTLLISYFIEYYNRAAALPNYYALIFLAEIQAFIIGLFFSIENIRKWRSIGKIKVNYMFLILAMLMVLFHLPFLFNTLCRPLMIFATNRILRCLISVMFWYAAFRSVYKITIIDVAKVDVNRKQSIMKVLFIIVILAVCYFIELYIRMAYNVNPDAINIALFFAEIEALITGIFFSIEHIKTLRAKGKIKINYIFAILAIIFIFLRIPYTTVGFIYSIRMLRFLVMLFFWYALAHTFYKVPIEQSEGKDAININQN